jgi:hypothetical protein
VGRPGWHHDRVNLDRLGTVVAVLLADTMLLLVVGIAMWSDAPSPAEEAVGKGLVVLGVALALPALMGVLAYLASRAGRVPTEAPARNDWDPV